MHGRAFCSQLYSEREQNPLGKSTIQQISPCACTPGSGGAGAPFNPSCLPALALTTPVLFSGLNTTLRKPPGPRWGTGVSASGSWRGTASLPPHPGMLLPSVLHPNPGQTQAPCTPHLLQGLAALSCSPSVPTVSPAISLHLPTPPDLQPPLPFTSRRENVPPTLHPLSSSPGCSWALCPLCSRCVPSVPAFSQGTEALYGAPVLPASLFFLPFFSSFSFFLFTLFLFFAILFSSFFSSFFPFSSYF